MAGRASSKSSNTVDSNGPIKGHVSDFFEGRKADWSKMKGIGNTYRENGKNIGQTADAFLTDFGGGSFGKGAAKMGGYAVGGAMLWGMLFD
ncbi:MAG: hypothetical protein PHY47_00495 [Lachnospiraceae bacterium]|nr:hypothetical protein [Lachnospiraceae bacterium]